MSTVKERAASWVAKERAKELAASRVAKHMPVFNLPRERRAKDDLGRALTECIRWPENLPDRVRWTLTQSGQAAIYAASTYNWRMVHAMRSRLRASDKRLVLHVRTIISGPLVNQLAVWVSPR